MTKNQAYQSVIEYLKANPNENRPYVIKTGVGLKPTHPMYKGLLWRMELEGLLNRTGSKALDSFKWEVA